MTEGEVTSLDWTAPDYAPIWALRVKRLESLRTEGTPEKRAELLARINAHYRENPEDFISDWGCTFDPRNPERGLPAMMPFVLFRKQRQFIRWLFDRWKAREDGVVEKSRDMGCSWLCVGFAVWMWHYYPGTVSGFGSRIEDLVDRIGDPQSLFWKLRLFVRMLPTEFKPRNYNEDVHAPFMRLINPDNGSSVIGEAGKNIGRGGRTSIYFKDESAFYEQAQSIDNSLSMTSNCKIDVSTPNGEGNPFWIKRHGGKIPVFVFDWRDDPRKGPAWYAKQKATLTSVALAQEVDRDYSASVSNSYIPSDAVTSAQGRGPGDIVVMGPLRVGLDVARFGDDKTCISFRRGRALIRQETWGKTDLVSTAGRAKQLIDTFISMRGIDLEQIAVDSIGIGAGVADMMRGWYKGTDGTSKVVDVNSSLQLDDGFNFNLRSFMWSQMKEWISNQASLPNDVDLRTDLTGLRYFYKGGLLLIEAKADAKKRGLKSPDRADSLALTFAKPGSAKPQDKKIPRQAVADYPQDHEMGM